MCFSIHHYLMTSFIICFISSPGGHGGHGGLTQTVLVNDSHHIYSTPSPTTSPHPPHESQLTTSPHPPHKSQLTTSPHPPHESQLTNSGGAQHYEFAEGYLHNGAESHYEMEPGGSDDPEYALPRVTMQPYEVPLSALQQAGQVREYIRPTGSGEGVYPAYCLTFSPRILHSFKETFALKAGLKASLLWRLVFVKGKGYYAVISHHRVHACWRMCVYV